MEEDREFRKIGNGVEVERGLLAAKASVEIGANTDVTRGAGYLTEVVDLIDNMLQCDPGGLGRGLAADPSWDEHPRVKGDPDHRVSRGERFELVVAELPRMRHQRAAILVARPDRAVKEFEGFPKAVVAQMGEIKNKFQTIHFAQQIAAFGMEAAARAGSVRIDAGAVVRGADGAQTLRMSAGQMIERANGISAFKA